MRPVAKTFLWLGVGLAIAIVVALAVRRYRRATFYPGVVTGIAIQGDIETVPRRSMVRNG